MTPDQLIAAVPLRRAAGSSIDVVALADIPMPWRFQFYLALAGRASPAALNDRGACAYADDWRRWLGGELRPSPFAPENRWPLRCERITKGDGL